MPKPFTILTDVSRYIWQRFKGALSTALLTTFTVAAMPAHANKDDFTKEIKVVADKESIDLKNNLVIFTGNVSVLQGSLTIKANQLKVSQKEKKGTETFVATGLPATYDQTLEDGKPIAAQAKTIRYEVASRTLVLIGDAQLKQNDSVVNGETIRYNLNLQKLVAESSGSSDRVTAIFTPPAEPPTEQNEEQDEPQQPKDDQDNNR